MAVRLRVAFRTSARAVRRSMECLSPDLAVSPIRPSSAARFASLRLASRRRAARAPSAGSRRFPRLGQCPAGGHAALQDGVGGRATVMDSQFFPIYYRTSGSPVRKLPSDARYPAFRADSGDYLALEGGFGILVVRYGKISKIFFDSITVSEGTGRCGRASPRDRRLARRRAARDARRSVADPGNRRSTLVPRALRRAGAPCLPSSRGNAAIERQARGACPAKKPNPKINQRFPRDDRRSSPSGRVPATCTRQAR